MDSVAGLVELLLEVENAMPRSGWSSLGDVGIEKRRYV